MMIDVRSVSLSDLDAICRHREEMFREAGRDEINLAAMATPFRDWLEPRLADGRYFGFMAERAGVVVGGVGLMEIDWPPHPAHPAEGRRGYVLNLFVEPDHRGQGVARLLMQTSDDAFARRGIAYAILHATEAGRPLYERVGWSRTSEMAKRLRS
ncbi:MAG: GNAT family N-acetyltransferase [Rhizobium sp.]